MSKNGQLAVKVPGTLPAISDATTLLQAIATAASNPQADIEKMERLFKMHQALMDRDAEAAFNAAMSRAQARIEPVANNATNTQTNSRYAKLAAINRAIVPIYTSEGLAISFDTDVAADPKWLRVMARVSHADGYSRKFHLDLPLDDAGAKGTINKTQVHATASSNQYARRYLICMIFNVTTEDDRDGNATKKTTRTPDAEFIAKCEEAAAKGANALREEWQAGTRAQRQSCADELETLKETARLADEENAKVVA